MTIQRFKNFLDTQVEDSRSVVDKCRWIQNQAAIFIHTVWFGGVSTELREVWVVCVFVHLCYYIKQLCAHFSTFHSTPLLFLENL